MIQPKLELRVRAVLGAVMVLLSALASIATTVESDTKTRWSLPVTFNDTLEIGQTSKQFRVITSHAGEVTVSVDPGQELQVIVRRDGSDATTAEGSSVHLSCDGQLNQCSSLLVEVGRTNAAERLDFTVNASMTVVDFCCGGDGVPAELKIALE